MILFRAESEYSNGADLMPTDLNSKRDIKYHIAQGTQRVDKKTGILKPKAKTRFISTSKNIGVVAYKYAMGTKDNPNAKRTKVLLLDLPEDVKVYDFTDEKVCDEVYPNKKSTGRNYIKADGEVTVEGMIPGKYVREIPPIFVDILSSLAEFESGIRGRKFYNEIIAKILSGEINVENTNAVLDKIPFNSVERRFVTSYYKNYEQLETCGNAMFSKKVADSDYSMEDFATALRTQVLKKILSSEKIFELFLDPKDYNNTNVYMDYKTKFMNLAEKIYGVNRRKLVATDLDGKKKVKFYERLVFDKDIKQIEKRIDKGMEFNEDENGNIISCRMLRVVIDTDRGENETLRRKVNSELIISKSQVIPIIEPQIFKEFVEPDKKRKRRGIRAFFKKALFNKNFDADSKRNNKSKEER